MNNGAPKQEAEHQVVPPSRALISWCSCVERWREEAISWKRTPVFVSLSVTAAVEDSDFFHWNEQKHFSVVAACAGRRGAPLLPFITLSPFRRLFQGSVD